MIFPNDTDSDVLRMLQGHGHDMTKPMLIDFHIDCPTELSANEVVRHLSAKDFVSEQSKNEDGRWTVTIPVEMTPVHDEIVYFQDVLKDGLKKFGAKPDGWGSFGNKGTRS